MTTKETTRSGAVKVKPIKWDKHTDIDEWYSYDDGLWGISDYIVYNVSCGSDWRLKVRGHTVSDEFASPAEAMDKAQEDHDTRIIAALEPAEPATDVEQEELRKWRDEELERVRNGSFFTRPPESRLREAAKRVVWFDWSGNDSDAVKAIDGLRAALAQEDGQ